MFRDRRVPWGGPLAEGGPPASIVPDWMPPETPPQGIGGVWSRVPFVWPVPLSAKALGLACV